jgi:hypothetical protein
MLARFSGGLAVDCRAFAVVWRWRTSGTPSWPNPSAAASPGAYENMALTAVESRTCARRVIRIAGIGTS